MFLNKSGLFHCPRTSNEIKAGRHVHVEEEECSLFDQKKQAHNISTINNHVLFNHTTFRSVCCWSGDCTKLMKMMSDDKKPSTLFKA